MEVVFPKDAHSFLQMSQKALEEDEINGNLIFGLSNTLLKNENTYGKEAPLYSIVYKNNEISLIGLMTPPRNLLLYENKNLDSGIMEYFVENLYSRNIHIPGVIGEKNIAKLFMEKWTKIKNSNFKINMNLRVFKLTKVEEYIKPVGLFRKAEERDIECIIEFITNFSSETKEPNSSSRIKEMAENGIVNNEIYVWDNKNIVSMAKKQRPTKHGMAVGGVYTPLEHRYKGYATALVAELSQNILNSGKLFCTLYTDLSNPTSNSRYQKIGYKPIYDHISYEFN
jgi:predicted GNAT family acetyltransferase